MTKKMPKPKKADFMEFEVWLALSESALERQMHGGNLNNGFNEFNTPDFTPGKLYKTVGLTYHFYEDGSRLLCWMIFDDFGVLQVKSATEFKFPETKDILKVGVRNTEMNNQYFENLKNDEEVLYKGLLGRKILGIRDEAGADGIFIELTLGPKE